MLWFKMPKNLENIGIPSSHAALVGEIAYFANSKTGERIINATTLIEKHSVTRHAYYRTIDALCSAQLLTKGNKKGQYFWVFTWDKQHDTDTAPTQNRHSTDISSDTLTIEKKRVEKNRYIQEKKLLENYNKIFKRNLGANNPKPYYKLYESALKTLTFDQIQLSHKIIKAEIEKGRWNTKYSNPQNLFNSSTIIKRLGEIESHEESEKAYQDAVDYLESFNNKQDDREPTELELVTRRGNTLCL